MIRKTGALTADYHYSASVGSRYKKQQATCRNEINTDFVTFQARFAVQGHMSDSTGEMTDE
ncbi:hypothetical protein [Aeromonas salmonicida]|nr:hypothetical protein [Aeromonas salmonicida]